MLRYEKRRGRLLPERERALDSIGFDWGRPPTAAATGATGTTRPSPRRGAQKKTKKAKKKTS
jgi:hypothetical protein